MQKPRHDSKNLIIAIILSVAVLLVWQFGYEVPHRQEMARIQAAEAAKRAAEAPKLTATGVVPQRKAEPVTREQALGSGAGRVRIASNTLHGSIALKGARFDDLTLARYKQTVDPASPEVVLLSPAGTEHTYFSEFGWVSPDNHVAVPSADTVWTADTQTLTHEHPVTLRWDNGAGVVFTQKIALDPNYMFTITQQVENHTAQAVTLVPYALINRTHLDNTKDTYGMMHEGGLDVLANKLSETHYKDLREEGKKTQQNVTGWLGFTDKYWLTAIIPAQDKPITANFSYYESGGQPRYQADSMGQPVSIAPGATNTDISRMFTGAKEIDILDAYSQGKASDQGPIPLFDRAVDFGMLYFLTKPIFLTLNFFYHLIGNFGLAILLLTVCIKLILFPLANKSYIAMNQMKALQPDMVKLKERYGDDKVRMNQELMALYKREKVNPAAGCLPILVQIPVFFALYKVLYVTIEMRHAPFFGWITDLSAPDPTNIFTAFGLIPWTPPSLLHIGVWPLIMFVTMLLQQQINPKPTDPVQAKVMGLMPYFFLFILAPFAAGLVIYWAWNNSLSIAQQMVIGKLYKKKTGKHVRDAS